MPHPRVRLDPTDAQIPGGVLSALKDRFSAVRAELGLSVDYPPEALAEAAGVAADPQGLPEADETGIPFFTIDPPGSMDLDQAMHLEREGDGHRIRYAIADVPTFVRVGGHLDRETRHRGQTVYCPDLRGAAPRGAVGGGGSLLPDAVRPAFVWDLRLDGGGPSVGGGAPGDGAQRVERLDATVQAAVDGGTEDDRFRCCGRSASAASSRSGHAAAPACRCPSSRCVRARTAASPSSSALRCRRGVERPDLAADGHRGRHDDARRRLGVLRTMPAPTEDAVQRFRRAARGLGGGGLRSGVRRVHPGARPHQPRHLALIHEATALFRGAGYTAFAGPPKDRDHAAVAAPYAHVTAPLRRLVDRFGLVVCEAVCRGGDVPVAVREALPELPELMRESDRRARAAERACADATEAAVLHDRAGESFAAVRPRPHGARHGRPARRPRAGAGDRRPQTARVAAPGPARARRRSGGTLVRQRLRAGGGGSARPYTGGGRVGRTVASVGNHRRGRSGLRRAGWWPTATRGDPRDSATENRPPLHRVTGGGARVKRCKRPPAAWVTRSAR